MNTNDEVKFVYLQSGQTPATPDAGTVYFNPTTKDISVGDVAFQTLPSASTSDNGKVLSVVEGAWNKMNIPESVEQFNIQFKYNPATQLDDVELTNNKTTADIKTAINNGKDVILNYTSQDEIYILVNLSPTKLTFINATFVPSDGSTTWQNYYNTKVIVFDMTSGDTNEGQIFGFFNIPNLPIPNLNETDKYLSVVNGMYMIAGIDGSFNTSSTRPIQNKVIAEKAAIYFPNLNSATFYNPIRMNSTFNKFEVASEIQLADVDLSIDSTTGMAKISTNLFKDYTFRYLRIYGNHLIFNLTQNNVTYKLKLTSVKYKYNETAYIVLTGFDAYTNEVIKLIAECAYSDFYTAKPEFTITRIAIPVTP